MASVTLKEKAYASLKQHILTGTLTRGENLTERTLVEMLQMSRTPIRAALEKLESEGLVTYTPNKGITITEFSLDKAVDFYDFRMILEPHVVKTLANRRIPAEQLDAFKCNIEEQQECVERSDYTRFTVLDSQFHRMLALSYGNSEVVSTMEQLQDKLFQIALRVLQKDPARIGVSYGDHVTILSHIEGGRPDEAERHMHQHLDFGKRILIY